MKNTRAEIILWMLLAVACYAAARLGFAATLRIVRGGSQPVAMFFIPAGLFALPFLSGFMGFLFYSIPASLIGEKVKEEDKTEAFLLLGHTFRSSCLCGLLALVLAFTPLAHSS